MRVVVALLLMLLMPFSSYAYISGIDDTQSDIPREVLQELDIAFLTYYQEPTVEKINIILDSMNDTQLLQRKTAWAPLVSFLAVVFERNKTRVFDWITRNDYNTYAQDVFVAALLHARLQESASVFAQAHSWSAKQMLALYSTPQAIDLKELEIVIPGHIDSMWGAFFASGDTAYVEKIVNALFLEKLPPSGKFTLPAGDVLAEDKRLAAATLGHYAVSDPKVNEVVKSRIAREKDKGRKKLLQKLLVIEKPVATLIPK